MDGCSSEESSDSETEGVQNSCVKLLSQARSCFKARILGPAFAQYLILLKTQKALRSVLSEEFIAVLECWTDQLINEGKLEQAFNCYKQALAFYSRHAGLHNSLGATLFRLGYYNEARTHLEKALEIDPTMAEVKESLESVSNLLVERWHFRMLNDQGRNSAYMAAIQRAVSQGYDTVLDIGSGTGILSMFAARAGAKEIYACEMNETMCNMSRRILTANHMADQVTIINKKSTDMVVGVDMPQPATLIVTEIMDCALLGEGIVPTLKHAWKNLLSSGNPLPSGNQPDTVRAPCADRVPAKVIPASAKVMGMVVECQKLRQQNRLSDTACGLKMPVVTGADTEYGSKSCFDPYGSEYMSAIGGGYSPLSEPFVVAEYDFSCKDGFILDKSQLFRVPVTAQGVVDAVIVWFDLHLDDVSRISTAPWSENLCWEQAVYPTRVVKPGGGLLVATPGSLVCIAAKLDENYIRLEVQAVSNNDESANGVDDISEEFSNTIHDTSTSEHNDDPMECCQSKSEHDSLPANGDSTHTEYQIPFVGQSSSPVSLSCSAIRRLNDEVYHTQSHKALQSACTALCQSMSSHGVSVLNMCDSASLVAVLSAKDSLNQVMLMNLKKEQTEFVRKLAHLNGVEGQINISVNTAQELVASGSKFDVIIADVVEACGVLSHKVLQEMTLLKEYVLNTNHLIVPSQVKIFAQYISCPELAKENQIINNEVTLGLDIARFMNEFSVDTHIDVDLAAKSFTPLTEPFELLMIDLMGRPKPELIQQATVTTRVINNGVITGIPYWFEVHLSQNNTLRTGPCGYSGSHWHQAVVILKEEVVVCTGDELTVTCVCKNSCVSMSVTKIGV